jgi:hypothetical protein
MSLNIQVRFVVVMLLMGMTSTGWAGGKHRLGGGVHYWQVVDDIDVDDIDEDGIAWVVSYQYKGGDWLGLIVDFEGLPDGFAGSDEDVYAPQAYLTVGSGLYGGIGIGWYYSDGDFADDPFYAFRVGVEAKVLPSLYLDINANYRINEWESSFSDLTDDIDEDTVTLGAALRLELN